MAFLESLQDISGILIKPVIAIIIILVGFIIGKVIGRVTKKILHEIELDNIIKSAVKVRVSLEEIISNIASYLIYFITIVIALRQMGLATFVLDLLFAGVMIVIILAVFLGIKDFIPNMMAGVVINQKGVIKEGSKIRVKDVEGVVEQINLIETKIKTKSGDIIQIPNSLLTKERVVIKKK